MEPVTVTALTTVEAPARSTDLREVGHCMATLECKREETAVLLSCQADSVKLVSALHAARREVQQAEALSVDEAEREAIERFLRKRTVDMIAKISLCTTFKRSNGEEDAAAIQSMEQEEQDAASTSTLESEIQRLRHQVVGAADRISKLRREGPGRLYEQQKASLLASRPPPPPAEQSLQHDPTDGAQQSSNLKTSSEALQRLMEASVADIPSLRAEVDDSMNRLTRVLSSMNASQELATPSTVERAFRPCETSPPTGVPSPQMAHAVSAGKIATRRRVASHMRPVPYPTL